MYTPKTEKKITIPVEDSYNYAHYGIHATLSNDFAVVSTSNSCPISGTKCSLIHAPIGYYITL